MKYNDFDLRQFIDIKTAETTMIDMVDRFKAFRKARKLSRRELSVLAKVSYGSIRRFEETGEISLTSLLKLAEALNCLDDFNKIFKPRIAGRLEDQ